MYEIVHRHRSRDQRLIKHVLNYIHTSNKVTQRATYNNALKKNTACNICVQII